MEKFRKILLISDGFYLLSGGLLGPIYALFVEEVGGDLLDASITFALFMLTAGIVVFLLSLWEDRVKHHRKFVIAGYALGVVGTFGYLLVESTMSLFIVQIVLGFSAALKDPSYDALFSESSTKRHLVFAWGEWEAMDYFTLGIGALMGGVVAHNFGFDSLLLIMFGFSILSFLISLFLLQRRYKNV